MKQVEHSDWSWSWGFVFTLLVLTFLTIWLGMARSCQMHADELDRDIRIEQAKHKEPAK